MFKAYGEFWNNLFNFSGTASRSQYWWPIIFNYIIGGVIVNYISTANGYSIDTIYTMSDLTVNTLAKTIAFLVWLGTLSLKFRRLHDSDHSGGWILISFIPFIGTIWFFILMILPTRRNRWTY